MQKAVALQKSNGFCIKCVLCVDLTAATAPCRRISCKSKGTSFFNKNLANIIGIPLVCTTICECCCMSYDVLCRIARSTRNVIGNPCSISRVYLVPAYTQCNGTSKIVFTIVSSQDAKVVITSC